MIEILEEHFPAEVAQRIFRYQSHPTADIMRELINRSKPYGVTELLNCIHYGKWNTYVDGSCKWIRKHHCCGCRICMEIRETRFSNTN